MAVVVDVPLPTPTEGPAPGAAPAPEIRRESNEDFLNAVLGEPRRLHYLSRDKTHRAVVPRPGHGGSTYNAAAYGVPTVSLALQAIHEAFAAHEALSLRPDTLWYLVVHEVAEHVRQNADTYASLFTRTPGEKQTIEVRDDSLSYVAPSDWQRSLDRVREPLAAAVTADTLELFVPSFTTSTIEDSTALLVAFMDTVSAYYDFEWVTLCGIPRIRLEGEAADWADLRLRAQAVADRFPGLRGYFGELLPVLAEIARTAATGSGSEDFWRSIYKHDGGSGGPFVTGWITSFFAHVQTADGPRPKSRPREPYATNEFPAHVSTVPFVWDVNGTEYPMMFAAGVTGVDHDGTYLIPRLGFVVAER